MFGLLKSKEKKIVEKAESHFRTAKRASDSIVALDVEHNKDKIIKLVKIFNEENTTALRILFEAQEEFNLLKKGDEIEFIKDEYNYISELMPLNYMSKKDYSKFEEVTANTIAGLYGEYNGV